MTIYIPMWVIYTAIIVPVSVLVLLGLAVTALWWKFKGTEMFSGGRR